MTNLLCGQLRVEGNEPVLSDLLRGKGLGLLQPSGLGQLLLLQVFPAGLRRKAEALLTQLDARKAIVLQENELLRHEVEHIRDADVLAHLARKKLGLVAPDEIIFIDVSNQTGG